MAGRAREQLPARSEGSDPSQPGRLVPPSDDRDAKVWVDPVCSHLHLPLVVLYIPRDLCLQLPNRPDEGYFRQPSIEGTEVLGLFGSIDSQAKFRSKNPTVNTLQLILEHNLSTQCKQKRGAMTRLMCWLWSVLQHVGRQSYLVGGEKAG